MKGYPEIIAEIGFNRDDDKKEFELGSRVTTINCFTSENENKLGLSLDLGRKENDTINLIFNLEDLTSKIIEAILERES